MLVRRENSLGDEAADGRVCLRRGPPRPRRVSPRRGRRARRHGEGDAILTAQGANTPPRPAVAVAGRLARSVEHRGDRLVGHPTRQGTNEINHLHVGGPSRLTHGSASPSDGYGRRLCQWTISSNVSPTVSTMISEMTVRMIFLRLSAWCRGSPIAGEVLTKRHEAARGRPRSGPASSALSRSISSSRSRTAARRSFHRRSSSPATSRFSGRWHHTGAVPWRPRSELAGGPARADLSSRSAAGCALRSRPAPPSRPGAGPGQHFLGKNPVDASRRR